MIVVGENLLQLIQQHSMVDRQSCYDETCIQLTLGESCIQLAPTAGCDTLTYGEAVPRECFRRFKLGADGLLLGPKAAVLASSAERVRIPQGYMGLLQTKGSLARMFVSLHFSDGQVDPGFEGKVTFEIFNASDFNVRIRKLQPVGNLYILQASTKKHSPYMGKYAGADGPTMPAPFT